MQAPRIICIKEQPNWIEPATVWFSEKWQIPQATYLESMLASQKSETGIPNWWIVVNQKQKIIAGVGVIANDFHNHPELTPNLCALYVEESARNQGIAGELLQHVCENVRHSGYEVLYLLTDHTTFYEKYGWHFFTRVTGDSGESERMYRTFLTK